MRALLSIAVVLLAGIAGLLALETFNHPPDSWSYAVIAPKDDQLIDTLNKAGALGWEVVSARRATSGEGKYSTAAYEMIMKRRGITNLSPTQSPK